MRPPAHWQEATPAATLGAPAFRNESTTSYPSAVLVVLVSSALSFALVSYRLKKLDLLGVLKARE